MVNLTQGVFIVGRPDMKIQKSIFEKAHMCRMIELVLYIFYTSHTAYIFPHLPIEIEICVEYCIMETYDIRTY